MTLIVGLCCADGLVVASDSQATASTSGQPTRHSTQKLFPLGDSIVWGAAGYEGVMQRIRQELDKLTKAEPAQLKKPISALRARLVKTVVPVIKEVSGNYVPVGGRELPPLANVLFCGHTDGKPWILEIPSEGIDQQHEESGFCAVGSGDIFAHFAYNALRHHGIRQRTVDQATWLAYRLLDDAIEVAGYGLGPPIQMWLIRDGTAKRLSDEEIKGIRDGVQLWKSAEAETLSGLF